jgi:hypothetical protein
MASLMVASLAAAAVLTGCGGSAHQASGPTTTLLQRDDWTAPIVRGPASDANFCTVIIAMYQHQAQLPSAPVRIKEQILGDFVSTVPEALAAAPPAIAAAAHTYLTDLAALLAALARNGLDYKTIPAGTLAPLVLDPNVKAAASQVLAYSQTVCHYSIGGAPS